MSTIKTETLSTPSNATVPVDTVVNGTAKAWVNFNGTGTVAIRRAFNVSSITDEGVGLFTINFTNAMVDTSYAITGTTMNNGQMGVQIRGSYNTIPTLYTTSAVSINTTQANSFYDCAIVTVAIFSN